MLRLTASNLRGSNVKPMWLGERACRRPGSYPQAPPKDWSRRQGASPQIQRDALLVPVEALKIDAVAIACVRGDVPRDVASLVGSSIFMTSASIRVSTKPGQLPGDAAREGLGRVHIGSRPDAREDKPWLMFTYKLKIVRSFLR